MSFRLESPRVASWLPWSFALVFSALAHVGLFRLNPNLLMGQPPIRPLERTAPSLPPMHMEELRLRELRKELPRLLDAFPEASAPAGEVAPSPLESPAMGEALPAAFNAKFPEPTTQMAALPPSDTPPELEEPPSDWQPRQEVLAITGQRLTETLDFLPKVLLPTEAESTLTAPDIRLPSDAPPPAAAAGLAFFAPPPKAFAAIERANGEDFPAGFPGLLPSLPDDLEAPPGLLPPATDALPEAPSRDITGMEPVESLLRIDTRVYIDPAQPNHRYFKIQILRDGIETLPVLPRDVVFLVDASASMTQEKVDMAVEGVRGALDTLRSEDRVNVIVFRERVEVWAEQAQPADTVRKAGVRTFLSNLSAYGRTDVFASLETLRSMSSDPLRPVIALLVTDGVPTQGITGTSEILNRFSRDNDGVISVFGIGSGRRVNRLLLDFLSFRNRGDAKVVDRNRDLPAAVLNLSEQVARPVLGQLSYQFAGAGDLEVYPARLTHLYLDRPLILVGRAPVGRTELAFQMIGRSRRGEHDLVFGVNLAEALPGGSNLRREWAWQAILEAIAANIGKPGPENRARIQALADQNGIQLPAIYPLD